MNNQTQALFAILQGMGNAILAFILFVKNGLVAEMTAINAKISNLVQNLASNLSTAGYTIASDTNFGSIVVACAADLQDGLNEIRFATATDGAEYTVSGLNQSNLTATSSIGHGDIVRFRYDLTAKTVSNITVFDDRTTQRLQTVITQAETQALDIAALRTAVEGYTLGAFPTV